MATKSPKPNAGTVPIEDDERHSDLVDDFIARNRDALNASIRKGRKELAAGKGSTRSMDNVIAEGRRRNRDR
jgi:hypothetical protein